MLSVGVGSICDVCLDVFGPNVKPPHVIQCGHVFCLDCLNSLPRLSCPLCRTHFDHWSVIKLHVDVDGAQPSSPQTTNMSAVEQEARRLQEAIATVANEGTTEPSLRELIAECKAFLSGQQRSMFTDLRVSLRMVAYMCEVKAKLRSQNSAVKDLTKEILHLESEKADLQLKIENLVDTYREERKTASAVETSLRGHCSRADAALRDLSEQYKFLREDWIRLNDEVTDLRMTNDTLIRGGCRQKHIPDGGFVEGSSMSRVVVPSSIDHLKLKGLSAPDQSPGFISPLPEFTGGLPTTLESFTALPDLDDDVEKPEVQDQPQYTCDAAGHPYSCNCVPFSMFPEKPESIAYYKQYNKSSKVPSVERVSPRETYTDHIPCPSPPPEVRSGIALTAPPNRAQESPLRETDSPSSIIRSRSHSHNGYHSGSYNHSLSPSAIPTRPNSPLYKPTPDESRQASPDSDIPSSSPGMNIPQGRETAVLRTRLHDLLHDSGSSSSLPNMPISHPALHDTHENNVSRPPSRSGTSASQRPSLQRHDSYSHPLSNPPGSATANATVNPPPSSVSPIPYASGPHDVQRSKTISRASSAAQALEKAQQAEKERLKAEKEQERERRRSERARDKSERELSSRGGVDVERSSRTQQVPAASSKTLSGSRREAAASAYASSRTSSGTLSRQQSVNAHSKSSANTLRELNNVSTPPQRHHNKSVVSSVIPTNPTATGLYA